MTLFRMKAFTTMCVLVVSTFSLWSQERDTSFRYGFWLAGGFDSHQADFSKFTDVGFCCPSDFGAQSGLSAYVGGLVRFSPFDVLDKRLIFDVRLSFGYWSADLTTTEQTLFNDPSSGNNQGVEASFDYIIAPTSLSASLDIAPSFRIVNGLAAHVGMRIGYLFSDSYEQTEKITDEFADQGFVFMDTRTAERNIASGSIPGLNQLQLALLGGLSYEFALNREGTVFVAPEIFYVYGLSGKSSSVIHTDGSEGTWKSSTIQVGISVRFASGPTVKPDPCDTIIDGSLQRKSCPPGQVLVLNDSNGTCFCRDTTTVVDSIVVRIDGVRPVDSLNVAGQTNAITIESYKVRHWRPVLPFVFFEQGTAQLDLRDRYRDITPESRINFDLDPSFAKDYSKHLLNIVGRRLFEQANDTVSIVGYSNTLRGENDGTATDRAYAVRDYLYRRWNIGFDRMKVSAGGKRELERGAFEDENYAAEIRGDNPSLFAPVEMPGTDVVVRPTHIRIDATIDPGVGRTIASVEYELRLGGGTGRRPKPLSATFNAGEPGFDSAMKGWSAAVGVPGSRIYDAVVKQLTEKDLILMPSLNVTFSTGQRTEAERDVKRSTIAMETLTPDDKKNMGRPDTAILVLDVLFADPSGVAVEPAMKRYLSDVLKDVPRGSKGFIEVLNADATSRTQDAGLIERRRESVTTFFQEQGIQLSTKAIEKRDDIEATTAEGATFARAIRVIVRAPLR